MRRGGDGGDGVDETVREANEAAVGLDNHLPRPLSQVAATCFLTCSFLGTSFHMPLRVYRARAPVLGAMKLARPLGRVPPRSVGVHLYPELAGAEALGVAPL